MKFSFQLLLVLLSFAQIVKAELYSAPSMKETTTFLIAANSSAVEKKSGAQSERTEASDKKRINTWRTELKSAEKTMSKVCKKRISVELDAARFQNFLFTADSPGLFCAEAFKVLEFNLCPERNYKKKVIEDIDKIKCLYTSKADKKLKMKISDKVLMIGFSENTKEINDESILWFQNHFLN